jgi:hypothetical protein
MEDFDELKIDMKPSIKDATSSSFQIMFDRMVKDMNFVGTFTIIYGALSCLSIIGALFGVPFILAGLRIKEAADHFSFFKMTNNPTSMKTGFEFQGRYFRIFRIMIIVGLVMMAVSIILVILFITYFMNMFMQVPSTRT